MSISLGLLKKVRCRVLDQATGRPLPGVAVSLSIGTGDGDRQAIPVSTLSSDATGYISFDLQPLVELGVDSASSLLVSAPRVGIKNRDLLKGLTDGKSDEPGFRELVARLATPAVDRQKDLWIEFPVHVDEANVKDIASDYVCRPVRLASIQRPDRGDYELSPYSFVAPTRITTGDGCCEVLTPSTLPVQEHLFHRIIVRRERPRDDQVERTGRSLAYRMIERLGGSHYDISTEGSVRTVDIERGPAAARREIKFAEVLDFRQRWYAIGHALGEIKYSLPLAPGESTQLAVIDWSRNDTAGRFDEVLGTEFLQHELHRDRSIEESIEAALHERQGGWSWQGGLSSGMTYDTYAYGKYSGDWTAGGSTKNTWGDRNMDGESLQDLHDGIIQGTSYVRSLNSTVIVQATQAESNVVQTRRVANHNHCHALTIEYYEVLRHFRLTTEFVGRRTAILIPFSLVTFTRDLALRFETLLKRALREEKLASCFDALVRLKLGPGAYADQTAPTPASEEQTQDDTGYFFGPGGPVGVDANASSGVTATPWTIKKGSILTLTATSDTGIKFGREGTAKTYGPEGSDLYGYPPEPTMHAAALLADIGGDRYEIGVGRTITAKNDGRLRFLFNDPSWTDNQGIAWVDIVVKRPPPEPTLDVTAPSIEQKGKPAITEQSDKFCEQRLLNHLEGNKGYYNRAIWFLMDPGERRLYLEDAISDDSGLLAAVDDYPIAVSGSHVAFPFDGPVPDFVDTDSQARELRPLDSIVTLPTRGLFAEAQLGHCNSCEKRDITRASDWSVMTVEEPPAISGIEPGPRGQMPALTPTQLPSNVIQIQQPPAAPDPTGLAAALRVLGTANIFRDMSGLDEVSALLGKMTDGTTKTLEDMIKTATQAKDGVDAERAKAALGGDGTSQKQTPGERYDNLQVAKEVANSADELGLDDQQAADLAQEIIGGESGGYRVPIGDIVKVLLAAGADAGIDPVYWPRPTQPRIVAIDPPDFPGGFFDFKFTPIGDGLKGTIEGQWMASGHDGAYTVKANEPGRFEMDVNIGDDPQHKNDLNVTLKIEGRKATVVGTYHEGKSNERKTAPGGDTSMVDGAGTKANPFSIKTPPDGELRWY